MADDKKPKSFTVVPGQELPEGLDADEVTRGMELSRQLIRLLRESTLAFLNAVRVEEPMAISIVSTALAHVLATVVGHVDPPEDVVETVRKGFLEGFDFCLARERERARKEKAPEPEPVKH